MSRTWSGLLVAGTVAMAVVATGVPAAAAGRGGEGTVEALRAPVSTAALSGLAEQGAGKVRPDLPRFRALAGDRPAQLLATPPTSLVVTPGAGSLALSWSPPADAGTATGAIRYDVAQRRVGDVGWTTAATALAATTVTLTGLPNGITREVRVAARDDSGLGPWSATATGTPVGVPPAPQVLDLVDSGGGSFTVSWSIPSDGGSPLLGWRIEHAVEGSGTVITQVPDPQARSATVDIIGSGLVQVSVVAINGYGPSSPSPVVSTWVAGVSQTLTLSTSRILPYVDGYLDAVLITAASSRATSGTIVVSDGAGRRVAARALAAGTSWSWRWAGRRDSGLRVPPGRYVVSLRLRHGGVLSEVARRSVTVARTQVGRPALGLTSSTVFPARDGYRDNVAITVRTTVPASGELRVLSGARVLARWTLPRGTSWRRGWNGRLPSGAPASGRISVVAVVKAGEGSKKSAARALTVSPKKLVAVSYSRVYTAASLARGALSGTLEPGLRSGSVGLWSSPSESDIVLFGISLPAGVRYGPTTVMGCALDSWYDGRTAVLAYVDAQSEISDRGALLGDTAACWYGDPAPASYVVGRTLRWVVGNIEKDYSWYYVDGFKIKGVVYVLK